MYIVIGKMFVAIVNLIVDRLSQSGWAVGSLQIGPRQKFYMLNISFSVSFFPFLIFRHFLFTN